MKKWDRYCWGILRVTKAEAQGTCEFKKSDEDHSSWILNDVYDLCYVFLSCSWDHTEVQKDPIKDTNLGSYYWTQSQRETMDPQVCELGKIKPSSGFHVLLQGSSDYIYIYLHSFWWGGIEQCKCMVIFRRMSLIIVHCLDRTKKMTFVAGINSMHPRHAVDTCPLKGLQFASSPDGWKSIDFRYWEKKGADQLRNERVKWCFFCRCLMHLYIRKLCWLYHPFVIKLLLLWMLFCFSWTV